MKVTVIDNKSGKNNSLFSSILLLILGIFLTFNANGVISTIFSIMGVFVILYGMYRFIRYYQLKKQFQLEEADILVSGILFIILGIGIIFLSSFFANAIQIVTGIWLIFLGASRLSGFDSKNLRKDDIVLFIGSILIILMGIYTIFSENIVFVFIGISLILYSVFDIVHHFNRK